MRFLIKKKEETFSMALSFLLFGAITSLLFLKKESSWTKRILGSDLQVHQEREKARSFVIEDYDRKCFLLHSWWQSQEIRPWAKSRSQREHKRVAIELRLSPEDLDGHTNHAHAIDSWKGNDHFVKSRDSLGASKEIMKEK